MCKSIRSNFLTIGERRVHYRSAGTGPPVVMLHPSPNWARALDPYIEVFADHFTAIALDTPGYGYSDPLDIKQPEISDFAEALKETLDGLGIGQCGIWGSHTGATIAMEFVVRYPEIVSIFVTDGYPAYDETTRADMLKYHIPPYMPKWDGSHLLQTWHKFREMFIFSPTFKWHKQNRTNSVPPSPAFIQDMILPRLITGESYTHAYSAVFRYEPLTPIEKLSVPTCFGARSDDSLIKGFPLIEPLLKPGCWIEEINPDKETAAMRYLEILKTQPIPRINFTPPKYKISSNTINRRFLNFDFGQIAIHYTSPKNEHPVVLLPPIPGDISSVSNLLIEMEKLDRQVIAIDMPGNGDSDNWNSEVSIKNYADILKSILHEIELSKFNLIGLQGGASIALEYFKENQNNVVSLILYSPIAIPDKLNTEFQQNYALPIKPSWDGTHLINLWFSLRNQQLFWPWYSEKKESIRYVEPQIDPGKLSQKLTGILKHYRNYSSVWKLIFNYPMIDNLRNTEFKETLILTDGNDPFCSLAVQISEKFPDINFKSIDSFDNLIAQTIDEHFSESGRL